ncbi:MAG: hypothetical protein ABEL97_10835 [Salinibacter sp.]
MFMRLVPPSERDVSQEPTISVGFSWGLPVQYVLQTANVENLRDAQEQFIQAEGRLLTAQFEAKQAEVELLRLSGQLLDRVRTGP